MAKKTKEYKVKRKRSFPFHLLRGFLKIFLRKPGLVNLTGGELSKLYNKRTSVDLPAYNVYYSKKKNTFIVDSPLYINELLKEAGPRKRFRKFS